MDEWVSVRDAALALGVSESTVYRSLVDPGDKDSPAVADAHWGPGNWRRKPLTKRGDLQLRRSAVVAKARGEDPTSNG